MYLHPPAARCTTQLQQDPLFQANLQKYIENLQFSVQQQQNAITGRLGVQ